MNIYGTADIGTMAFETPISALIRKIAVDKKKVFRALFGETTRTPTFAQFVPSFTSFSERSGELFVHGDSVMPLVNYAVGDRGGVLTFDEVHKRLKKEGIEIKKIAKEYGISDTVREMPFVFVYERIDFSTSLYGLQIYPEPVREAILMRPFSTHCTGKCALEAEFDEEQNQYLRVHVELQGSEALPAGLTKILIKHIVKQIETKNAEYRELVKHVGVRAHPKITFWPRGDEKYFKQGIKQKWVV